jgi:phosphoglycolate phosphatase
MKNYKHIIWDWNGTLVDDARLCCQIINELLVEHDLPGVSAARYAETFHFPLIDYYRELGFDFDRISYEMLCDGFMDGYYRHWRQCSLSQGSEALMRAAAEKGVLQSIISACEQQLLEDMVVYFKLTPFFTSVIGASDNLSFGKLEIGRQWMQQMTLNPADVLLVGDTLHDFELAQQLGTDCILVCSGYQTRQCLETSGVPVFDSLSQVKL